MGKETWIIEPHDPLIVRDGRPFSNTAGIRAKSVDFPFPSTTTGGARTRSGLEKVKGDLSMFDKELSDEVLQIEVSGALLVEVQTDSVRLLLSAPADCLVVKAEEEGEKNRYPLVPLENDNPNFCSNLDGDLHLLGTTQIVKGKAQSEPRFWYWDEFRQWLKKADEPDVVDIQRLGHQGPTKEQRTHVRILDEESGYRKKANSDGGLFQTRGLEFTQANEKNPLSSAKRLGLMIEVDRRNFGDNISNGLAPLGGERRIVSWLKGKATFPACPDEIKNRIVTEKACRLILLTPAILEQGFKPTWLKTARGLNVVVEAIAVNRTQVISGWDFIKRKPKPTRRMCPAGTVFFLKLSDGDIGKWINEIWFHCVSDELQDRKDGFGLAALGTWNGKFWKFEEALFE
jgi:CRISPR-associated protein Cmr3